MTRCRYSEYGKQQLRPKYPDRCGEFLGVIRKIASNSAREGCVKVRWDGNKSVLVFAASFIEVLPDEEPICWVDLSRTPILRELLGIDQSLSKR